MTVRASTATAVRPGPSRPKAVVEGTISLQKVAAGSKSERTALTMAVGNKKVVIERLGGNPFQIDAQERALVGKKVKLEGFFVNERLFRYTGPATDKKLGAKLEAAQKKLGKAKEALEKHQNFMTAALLSPEGSRRANEKLKALQADVRTLQAEVKALKKQLAS